MPSRFYFPAAEAAAVSPPFDPAWLNQAQGVRRRLTLQKGSSAIADGTSITLPGAANRQRLDRQYVSDPLVAQTISGTVKCQLQVRESAADDNIDRLVMSIRVCSNDGSSVRGTLLSLANHGPQTEYSTSNRNKTGADGDALSSLAVLDGDRLVIEIGHDNSASGTTPIAIGRWGEDAPDLPENETETSAGAGWVEFSGELLLNPVAFDAALEATGDLTASLATDRGLAASLDATGDLTATLAPDRGLAAALEATGDLTASLATDRGLGAALEATGDLTASLATDRGLGAALDATGDLTAALASDRGLGAALEVTGDWTTTLTVDGPTMVTIAPTGVASSEAFGTAIFEVDGQTVIAPTGVAGAEAFGTAVFSVAGQTAIAPSAIASAAAFGTAVVKVWPPLPITVPSIAGAEAFGIAVLDVAGQAEIAPASIASAAAFGSATLTSQPVTVGGVPIKTAVFEYLMGDATLVELIGNRLYPNAVPHGLGGFPYVTYRRSNYESMHHLGGAAGLARCDFRFDIRSTSSFEAGTIGERLRLLLDSLYASIGTTVHVFVQRCHLSDAEDDYIDPTDHGEIGQHRSRLDFEFYYKESLPAPLSSAR